MRRILDFFSFVLLGVVLLVTGLAVFGPAQLPEKVPTHLDPLGQPDAWAPRSSLEILPMIAVIVYLLLTVVAAYSSLAKHAAQDDPESGPPLEALILKLIVWIKAELMGIFTCIQLSSLHAARHLDDPSSFWSVCMWILLVAIFATVAWYLTAMIRMERSQEEVAS
ncbi:MAG: DUF1648 domain-containing protein [Terracidiphilus sp.]|jgi:uncharacterized membrane protein